MDLKLIGEKKTILLKINTDLDHHTASEIRKTVDARMNSSNAKNVIFDFTNVDFMDSSGIGVIMGRYKMTKILGGKVVIFGVGKNVRRIMEISGIEKIIKICADLKEALEVI